MGSVVVLMVRFVLISLRRGGKPFLYIAERASEKWCSGPLFLFGYLLYPSEKCGVGGRGFLRGVGSSEGTWVDSLVVVGVLIR